jgi:hypothetical protein
MKVESHVTLWGKGDNLAVNVRTWMFDWELQAMFSAFRGRKKRAACLRTGLPRE